MIGWTGANRCYLVFYLVDYLEHGTTKSSLMCVGEKMLKMIDLTFSCNKFSDFFLLSKTVIKIYKEAGEQC